MVYNTEGLKANFRSNSSPPSPDDAVNDDDRNLSDEYINILLSESNVCNI